MEGFSIQGNGLKKKENDQSLIIAAGDSIIILLHLFRSIMGVHQCLNSWLYNTGKFLLLNKRRKKKKKR